MTVVTCDLCGQQLLLIDEPRLFKVKERKALWWESGWEWIDVHDECVKKLLAAVKEKQNDEK